MNNGFDIRQALAGLANKDQQFYANNPQQKLNIGGNGAQNVSNSNFGQNAGQAEFDYKTSQVNQFGETLPENAKGWTPQGQVDWGGGLTGWANKVYHNVTGGDNREKVWEPLTEGAKAFFAGNSPRAKTLLKSAGEQFMSDISVVEDSAQGNIGESLRATGDKLGEVLPRNLEEATDLKRYGEGAAITIAGVGDLYEQLRDGFGGDSPLTPVLRGAESLVGGVFEGMGAVAQIPKFGFGAMQGIDSAGEGSWLPDFTKEEVVGETFSKILNVPLAGYNILRTMTAPGTWQSKQDMVVDNAQAGRVFFSSLVEPAIQQEFMRRMQAGEDPRLLAMELQNPWAELVGELIFDPMNAIGKFGKATQVAGMIDDAHDFSTTSRTLANPELGKLLDDALRVGSDEAIAAALPKIVDTHITTIAQKLDDTSSVFNQTYDLKSLTALSRRNVVTRNIGDTLKLTAQSMKSAGYNVEDVAALWGNLARAASKDPDVAAVGIAAILDNPSARLLLSDNGIDAQIFLNKMLTDANGKLTPDRLINIVKKADGDYVKLNEAVAGMMDNATSQMFPTVETMKNASETVAKAAKTGKVPTARLRNLAKQYDQLPQRVKFWSSIDAKLAAPRRGINNVLGFGYFTANPGYAIRNFTSNLTTMVADNGVGVFKKGQRGWQDEIQKWVGFQSGAQGGFGEVAGEAVSELVTSRGAAGVSEKIEEAAATQVIGFRMRDTMEKMLPAAVGDMQELKALGFTDEAADYFKKALVDNYGDVQATVDDIRKMFGNTGVETWRISNYTTSKEKKFLQSIGLHDEWTALQKRGASTDEIQDFFKKAINEYDVEAAKVINDPFGVSASNPAADMVAEIGSAAEVGFVNHEDYVQMQGYLEQAYQARDQLLKATNQAVVDATRTAQLRGDDAGFVVEQYVAMHDEVMNTAKSTRDAATRFTEGVRALSDEIKNLDAITEDDFVRYFQRAGLSGMPEVGMTREDLLNRIWDNYRTVQGNRWQQYYDASFVKIDDVLQTARPYISGSEQLMNQLDVAKKMMEQANDFRTAVFRDGKLRSTSIERVLRDFGIGTVAESGAKLDQRALNAINKYLDEGEQFATLADAEKNMDLVIEALNKRRKAQGLNAIDPALVAPYMPGTRPSQARALVENRRGFIDLMTRMESRVLDDAGSFSKLLSTDELETALGKFAENLMPKIDEARATSLQVAREWRDYALHFYGEKTYADLVASYYMPFQFWHTQTYKKMFDRLVTDPRIFAAFGKYRRTMEKINADAPEWWRYNVKVDNVLGYDLDHPLYFNLESSLWPLNGLTGVDFNDPYKRVDWMTSTIDDLGKFGPSQHYLVNMAVAGALYLKGEQDAASRWGGRMFSQTAVLKNTMAAAGFQPVELDPAVNFFSGGMDPYERNRVYRALSAQVQNGQISEEQAMDAAYYQDNEIWDTAVQQASSSRALPSAASMFLGVGFKPRTDEDLMVDNMYTEINRMYSMGQFMSPEEYRDAWTNLRTKYPFMDTVLLSKKAGDERDTSYAYNVLGRIPPGQTDDLLKLVGVNNDDIQAFYDSKGDLSLMQKGDRDRFMGAMADLGAMLLMPDTVTQANWRAAKDEYGLIFDQGATIFGEDIWDLTDMYYTMDNSAEKNQFLQQFPQVEAALDWKTGVIATSPILYQHYGSLNTLERYYVGNMYASLERSYGKNIMDVYSEYLRLKAEQPEAAKEYKSEHPEIEFFLDERRGMYDNLNRAIVQMAEKLPERPMVPVRPDFAPVGQSQTDLANALQPQPRASWSDFQQILSPQMQSMVVEYWMAGEEMTSAAESRLDYLAGQYGFEDGDAMMQEIGLSLSQ